MSQPIFDLHCHPAMKPYGQSFSKDPIRQNSPNRRQKNSLWYYDSPNLFERAGQLLLGICKFTQADCTTLVYGSTRIACASLYPIERGFFNSDLGTEVVSDLANAFVTGVGRQRVDYVQDVLNYFEDLEGEYDFYRQLNGADVRTESGKCRYRLVRNYDEIEQHMLAQPDDVNTVFIVMTIEGMHVLNENALRVSDEATWLRNVNKLKNWEHPPFFVTFAHHFYNHLCGHARSLAGLVGSVANQSEGLGDPFTPLGLKVRDALLDTSNGKRIYIDIKHMSAAARVQYLEYLAQRGEQIPVIISHGAANGLRSMKEPVADGKNTAHKLLAEDINFYDDELLAVARTRGIIGLQLDERRIASEATLKSTKHAIGMNKIRHYRSELLWNQVQHIVELYDRHDLFAWDNIAIGSDFDGVINPLNGFLTAETMPFLLSYLERHVNNYMIAPDNPLKPYNSIPASEIVNRIFSLNAGAFMKRWFL
ncbi:membrane dipeptidase [Chitinophaga lutea]